ncbi:MAG: GNAT family N-acetyltransferase [Dokdonella sp.]
MNEAGGVAHAGVAIRQAVVGDAPAISALVSRLTREFILPEQPAGAAEKLLSWMTTAAIADRMAAGHRYHIAESADALAGVAAIRDNAHLYLLFVDAPFQRRGIAQALWQAALAACIEAAHPRRITVNASAFAVPVYLRLGFAALSPAEEREAVMSTPMAFVIDALDSAAGERRAS